MTQRILSISGLRGVVGDGLDPVYIAQFAAALGTLADRGTVVLTRDGRSSGEMIHHMVLAGLTATGCRVVDAGIASTPTCGVLVDHLQAAMGLQITASHNPIEWNGLKPFSPDGAVFDAEQGRKLLKILESRSFRYVPWDQLGRVETLEDAAGIHLDRVLELIDVDVIRRRKPRVVLDCNHGSGAVLGPRLLESLGCEVEVLGGSPDGRFEHPPEPVAENLTGLCEIVRQRRADVGFAQDPDADRLAVVDETGRYIGEELTLALCADYFLARRPPAARDGGIVVNMSTSRTTADLAEKHGCAFARSPVGEANVVARMRKVSAVLGGEGNGGVIEPKVGYVRDSFVGMAYILAGLVEGDRPLSEWVDSLPRYAIVKDKVRCPREQLGAVCEALKSAYSDATPQEEDGLRLDWEDRWLHVRASNTEPIIRVIAEAPDRRAAEALCREAMEIVNRAVR